MLSKKLLIGALVATMSVSSFAHFQMIYTADSNISGKSSVPFELIFTHPSDGVEAHSMDIGKDEKGKGGGDWGLIFVPAPYYEASEEVYIQQITKVLVNKDDLATDWNKRLANGYPEIIPLSNPITWKDEIFRGQVVDKAGKPVANAEIEIEYLNANIKNSKFVGELQKEKTATVIYADANGYFSFVPVHKGYWGFAALGAGGEMKHNGKELSQDAVLWIEAK